MTYASLPRRFPVTVTPATCMLEAGQEVRRWNSIPTMSNMSILNQFDGFRKIDELFRLHLWHMTLSNYFDLVR